MLKRVLLLFIVLGLLAGCDLSKGIGAAGDAYKAATLSDADVAALGKQTAVQMDSQAKIAKGNKYATRLTKLTRNLKNEDGLPLNFKVYMTDDINAFALPDGSIRIYSGLMDLMNDDEVLYVVGHEIGHVKNGDTKDRFRMAYATSAARKTAEAAGGVAGALSKTELTDLGEAFIHAQFSQKQEYAADAYGIAMLKKYNKNVKGAVTALRKLADLGSGGGDMLSTHPAPGDRADRLEKQIKDGTIGK